MWCVPIHLPLSFPCLARAASLRGWRRRRMSSSAAPTLAATVLLAAIAAAMAAAGWGVRVSKAGGWCKQHTPWGISLRGSAHRDGCFSSAMRAPAVSDDRCVMTARLHCDTALQPPCAWYGAGLHSSDDISILTTGPLLGGVAVCAAWRPLMLCSGVRSSRWSAP
eukprot:COSAG01_NODE_30267_length_619_cov_1.076923_2_plen_164_part_01